MEGVYITSEMDQFVLEEVVGRCDGWGTDENNRRGTERAETYIHQG